MRGPKADVTSAISSRNFVAQLYRVTKSPYGTAQLHTATNCITSMASVPLFHFTTVIQKLSAQIAKLFRYFFEVLYEAYAFNLQ